jgi:hypothetical protein
MTSRNGRHSAWLLGAKSTSLASGSGRLEILRFRAAQSSIAAYAAVQKSRTIFGVWGESHSRWVIRTVTIPS